MKTKGKEIVIIIPCFNEEKTIRDVILDFRRKLPNVDIVVINNNSTDRTKEFAQELGAFVIDEYRQGKGFALRRAFYEVEADIYVIVDGDSTYSADDVFEMIQMVKENKADMVVGNRHANDSYKKENKRLFHNFGNELVTFLINKLFGVQLQDILSGYRVLNNFAVKSMPLISKGFEIETEITLRALELELAIKEFPIKYKDRPLGSISKLNTFKDGIKVIRTIFGLFKDHRPFLFFSALFGLNFTIGFFLFLFKKFLLESLELNEDIVTYLYFSFFIIALIFLSIAIVLHSLKKHFKLLHEQNIKILQYLIGKK